MPAPRLIDGSRNQILLLCDHASNLVPAGFDLGLAGDVLHSHVAWDIGAAAVTGLVAARLSCPALLATVSRLVVDCNRPPAASVPESSDGIAIPGNRKLPAAALAARHALHDGYHRRIAGLIEERRPGLLVGVHSFTDRLATAPAPRPWPVALLWNRDRRASEIGLAVLRLERDLPGPVGENEPYSGKILNYTMNRHAEDNNIPYLNFEIRQDLLQDAAGQEHYAVLLARVIERVREAL